MYKEFIANNFIELKRKAYKAALEGIKANFDKQWEINYISSYPPCSLVWQYEEVLNAYKDFLLETKTREQAKEVILEVQNDYERTKKILEDVTASMEAEEEAFKKAGIKYGKVTYTCPICQGEAWAERIYTPENPAHKVTIRNGCTGCGRNGMN